LPWRDNWVRLSRFSALPARKSPKKQSALRLS
jgi:hypothetical protein